MDLLEKFAPKKKKKTLVLTNVGKKARRGGDYILTAGLKISEPSVPGKKKPLVLTLGSPPKKGGKKNHDINPGQSAGKGQEKKTPGINPRQPVGKGRETKTLVLTLGSPPEKGGKKNPGQPVEKGRKKKKVLFVCPSRSRNPKSGPRWTNRRIDRRTNRQVN
jgi:hypothetical protein